MEIEDSVKFIRLNTGEDLVSQVTEITSEKEHYYVLLNPMKVMYISDSSGYMSISLMQWVFYKICELQEFTLFSGDIVTMGNPSEKLIDYYWNTVNKYDELLKVKKESEFRESLYDDTEIDTDPVDESEGLDMIKDILDAIKKNGKGTLH